MLGWVHSRESAEKEQGKCRESAAKTLLTPLTIGCPSSQGTAGEFPAPQAGPGWERSASRGPPAPPSEAPDRGWHIPLLRRARGFSRPRGREIPPELSGTERAAAPGSQQKVRGGAFAACTHQKHRGSCWEKSCLTG